MALYNIDFTKPGGYPATQDTLRLMQQTYRDASGAVADVLRELAGVTDPLYALVVSGCEMSLVGPNLVVTDGVAALPGELLAVDGATVAYNDLGVRLSVTNEAHPTLDPTTYLYSGSTHSVHLRRRAVVVPYTDPGYALGAAAPLHLRRVLLDAAQYEDGGGQSSVYELALEGSGWTEHRQIRAQKHGMRFADPIRRQVSLTGTVSNSTGAATLLVAVLPSGYRPSYAVTFAVPLLNPAATTIGAVAVDTDGQIFLFGNPSLGDFTVTLDGVSFWV